MLQIHGTAAEKVLPASVDSWLHQVVTASEAESSLTMYVSDTDKRFMQNFVCQYHCFQ